MNYWRLRDAIKHIIHPFKYGFWCQICIGKMPFDRFIKLAMFWEIYDSYAGDGDYGLVYAWTGNRKTWKELKYYKKFGIDDEGFVFIVPFFIAWLLVLPGTIAEHIKQIRECNRYYKDWSERKMKEVENVAAKINPEDKAEFDYIKYQLKHGVRLGIILYNLGYKKEQKVFEKLEEE